MLIELQPCVIWGQEWKGEHILIRILAVLVFSCQMWQRVRTYNGNLSTEVVFDFALLDGIWGVFVDDRGEL